MSDFATVAENFDKIISKVKNEERDRFAKIIENLLEDYKFLLETLLPLAGPEAREIRERNKETMERIKKELAETIT